MSDFAAMGHTAMVRLLVRCTEKDFCLCGIPTQSAESKFNCEEISHNSKQRGEFSKINGLLPSKKKMSVSKQTEGHCAHIPGWGRPKRFDKVITRGDQGSSLSPKAINWTQWQIWPKVNR